MSDADLVIPGRYRGPPQSGNGGYVSGLLAKALGGPATVALRAPIPLDAPLRLRVAQDGVRLESPEGLLIAEGRPASDETFDGPPPSPPDLSEATAAGRGFPGLDHAFHPVCFTCGVDLLKGEGLQVFVGPLANSTQGAVAGAWSAAEVGLVALGLVPEEIVWAVLDCPGSVAWLAAGEQAGLLGAISGRVLRAPAPTEETIVTAWRLERSGRKRRAGTALFTAGGELLAETRQVWIAFP